MPLAGTKDPALQMITLRSGRVRVVQRMVVPEGWGPEGWGPEGSKGGPKWGAQHFALDLNSSGWDSFFGMYSLTAGSTRQLNYLGIGLGCP